MPRCIDCGKWPANRLRVVVRCGCCNKIHKKHNAKGRTLPGCKQCGKKLAVKKNKTGLCHKCCMTGRVPWNKGVKGQVAWNKGKSRFKNRGEYRIHYNKQRRALRNSQPPEYHIADRIRTLVRNSLKKNGIVKRKLHSKTTDILGCSIPYFIQHLENQFVDSMRWSNYGNKEGQWNIDHIRPIVSFDLSIKENIGKAFHFTNCRPLWAIDNFRKGGKFRQPP